MLYGRAVRNLVAKIRPRALLGFSYEAWLKATREGSSVLIGQLGIAIIGFVGLRLITKLADREVFGESTLLLGVIALGRNIFVAPVTNTQLRYHAEFAQRTQLSSFTAKVAQLTRRQTIYFGLLGVPAFWAWRFTNAGGLRAVLFASLLLCLIAENARAVPVNWLTGQREQGKVAKWMVLDQLAALSFGALGLFFSRQLHLPWATELYIGGQGLAGIGVAYLLTHAWCKAWSTAAEERAVEDDEIEGLSRRYGGPFIPLAIVSWLMTLGDRFVLGGIINTDAVGGYVAAYSIASRAVTMPQGVLGGFARTILFQAEGRGDALRARRVFRIWMAASTATGIGVTMALWLCGSTLAALVLDPRFREDATDLMVGIGAGHAIFGLTQVVENRLLSLGISRSLILPAVLGGATNILCCLILVPRMGAWGAATAKVAAFGVNLVAACVALRTNKSVGSLASVPGVITSSSGRTSSDTGPLSDR